jgi:hypothetical protein
VTNENDSAVGQRDYRVGAEGNGRSVRAQQEAERQTCAGERPSRHGAMIRCEGRAALFLKLRVPALRFERRVCARHDG